MTGSEATDYDDGSAAPDLHAILGLEYGSGRLRGVRLEILSSGIVVAAVAEVEILDSLTRSALQAFDPSAVGPIVADVAQRLAGVHALMMPCAISFAPPNSGVGSGPALPDWLQQQAGLLSESLVCAGDLGIAFTPRTSLDRVIEATRAGGLEPGRVDLAPVAAARVLDMHEIDTVTVGSGRGWQARLRDAEVLEALEMMSIDNDAPLSVVDADNEVHRVNSYYEVGITAELAVDDPDLAQFAAAAGTALGLFYSSPANLLTGHVVEPRRLVRTVTPEPEPDLDDAEDGYVNPFRNRAGGSARTTLNLQRRLHPTDPTAEGDWIIDSPIATAGTSTAEHDVGLDTTAPTHTASPTHRTNGSGATDAAADAGSPPGPPTTDPDGFGVAEHSLERLDETGNAGGDGNGGDGGDEDQPDPLGDSPATTGTTTDDADSAVDPIEPNTGTGDEAVGADSTDRGRDALAQFAPDPEQEAVLDKPDGTLRNQTILVILVLIIIALVVYLFVL